MYILFDIGTTISRVAISHTGEVIDGVEQFTTPITYVDAMATFKTKVEKLTEGKKVVHAIGGIAGLLNPEKTRCVKTPLLPGWEKEDIQKDLSRLIGAPVTLENDGDIATLGEAVYGAGKEYDIVGYMSVNMGIGGGLVAGKMIAPHAGSFEPGFQVIDVHEIKTLEDYVSGAALSIRYNDRPEEINNQDTWNDLAHILAVGVANTIRHWSPHVLLLGGSVMTRIPIEETIKTASELIAIPSQMPVIVRATLDDPVLYGALALIKTI